MLAPQASLEVPAGDLLIAHEVVDFQRERPAWRLYMVSNILGSLCDALDWQNSSQVREVYEAVHRETAWGALYFAISQLAPMSAERMGVRLKAVLRFWDSLQSVRYRFGTPSAALSMEELMEATCNWATDAWCATGPAVRARLEAAAERMTRATREDSIEASLREMPRALSHARGLRHRELLSDPAFLRRRLGTLPPDSFERVSSACTSELLGLLYDWDAQLSMP